MGLVFIIMKISMGNLTPKIVVERNKFLSSCSPRLRRACLELYDYAVMECTPFERSMVRAALVCLGFPFPESKTTLHKFNF